MASFIGRTSSAALASGSGSVTARPFRSEEIATSVPWRPDRMRACQLGAALQALPRGVRDRIAHGRSVDAPLDGREHLAVGLGGHPEPRGLAEERAR